MDLDTLLDDVLDTHAVAVLDDGDRLVALRLADDWGVGMRLHRAGSHRRWDVREIALRITGREGSIHGNDVRELPLGALIAEARRLATRSVGDRRSDVDLGEVLAAHGGRFGDHDATLAALALAYVRLVEAGDRTPSKTLAARHGGAPGTWTNRVALARRRGFLTPVRRGEAGGTLTSDALRVLGGPDADAVV